MAMTAFHLGEMTKEEWNQLSLHDKCVWYYDRTHSMIEQMKSNFNNTIDIDTEDLSNPEKLAELADFLKIKTKSAPLPLRKNAFVYADVTQINQFYTPKAQWLFSNYNFPQSVEDELYNIDFFCECFISWNSYFLTKHEKGEFERYTPTKADMLAKVKRGRSMLAKWQREFANFERTVKTHHKKNIWTKLSNKIYKLAYAIRFENVWPELKKLLGRTSR